MGRFSQMLQNKSPSLSSGGVTPTAGSRFRSLSRDKVATYDKLLYAQIMGATPKAVTKPVVPARAESLTINNPVAGQDWRKNPQGIRTLAEVKASMPTMAGVRAADAAIPKPVTPTFKPYKPAPAEKLNVQNPVAGQSWRQNPQELKTGEVRTLKDVGKASKDAFDLWNAQGTKGVNGIMYWFNDLLEKTHPGDAGTSTENKKYFALQMDLASDDARAIMEKAKEQGTWYQTVVTAVNGGLSLLQSLAMGTAMRGGQVAGQMLAGASMKEAGKIAAGHLAKQVGYKAGMTALKQVVDKAVIDVGMPTAASWMPAWISSGIEGGAIYRERTAAGVSPLRASITAGLSIAGTALLESWELEGMYRTWSRNVATELAARMTSAFGQAVAETGQELIQGVWQNVIQRAVGQNGEQAIMSGEELLDTIIGIFPSSFILGAGTFNGAAFRQQYKAETAAITTAIKDHFGVDDATAASMLDEAVTKIGPAVREVFLTGLDTKEARLSDVLTFERTSDPYVQFLVNQFTKPIAETKQSAAGRGHFIVEPSSSEALHEYTALANAPTREQQTTGRHKWRNLLTAQQQAAQQGPLVPEVGIKPEFQKPGVNLEAPVQRPTGPITEVSTPARAPVAKSGGSAAISTPQVSVSTPTAATAPVVAPAAVTPAESTLFTAPTEPTQEERLIEKAKQKPAVQKSKAEQAMEEAGAEAEAQQQSAEDMDIWMKTPDELSNLETIRQMQAQFDSSDEGQKSATLRRDIAAIQSGTFTEQAKADLQEKKAELRRLHAAWDDAHGWLAQVNRAVDLGLYENAIATGDMTQEQVDGIMAIRQQMQQNQDLQDTADAQLDETKRLRAAIERQQEGTKPAFELTDEAPEETEGSDAWVGRRTPTARELLTYVKRHYTLRKDALDPFMGLSPEQKAARSRGETPKATIVAKNVQLAGLFSGTKEPMGMDELVDVLTREVGLEFPPTMDNETPEARLAEVLFAGAASGAKNAMVDYMGQPLNTPAARAARARQETPAETNPEDFANVVSERELGYTPEEQAVANRTGKQVGAVGTGETVVSRFVRSIAEKGDTILDFGAGAKAVQAQLLSRDGFNVTAYDFGQNAGPLHDAQALARRYDIVMAGNVLNVQNSQDMLGRTLDQIAAAVDADGVLVANLPMEPRKFSGLTADLVEQELVQRFENVRREGPRNAPVFVATNPIQAQVREDNLFTGQEKATPAAQRPAFSKQALQQAEAAKGGLKKAVESTRELTTRQATEEQEALDPQSLFGGMTTGTEGLFDQKVEEQNPEANRPIVPDEDLFATAAKEAKERTKAIIPLAREAVKTAADSAVSIGFPNGARIVGVGISKQFLYQGSLSLTGQHIKSAADLAVIGQIFRNPFFETIRYVWAKDGEVLYNEGRTSYMLSESEMFLKDSQVDIDDMIARAKKAGANELWLLHNHPNGWAMASRADYSATHRIEDTLCMGTGITLKGHVIVDTNQYGVIHTEPGNTGAFSDDPTALVSSFLSSMLGSQPNIYHADVYGMQTDNRYKQPFLKSPLIGQFVRNADTLATFAGAVKANDAFVTLAYTSGTMRTRLVQEVPFDWFVDNLDTVKTFIQEQGKAYGISKCFAVYSSSSVRMAQGKQFSDRVVELMREDVLTDGITYDSGIKMTEAIVSKAAHVEAPGFHKLGVRSQGVYKVQENTPTGYTFDDPRAATTPQNLRFVDALFTDFDEIVHTFNGLPTGEYQKAVEGWWQHQVWEQLKAAKIPADVFKPGEVVNKYRMSKGPKSTYNNMEWIKNKLEAWVRDQATTTLEEAKTKNLEPHAAVAVEQAARAAGVVQKPGAMLAPQPTKKTVSFMDPFWQAVEAKGGYIQHPESAGTDASTKDLLNIVNTYEGAVQMTLTQRKATRGMLGDSVTTTSHDLAEALGGGQALAKPFELPVITSKTNKMTSRESERSKLRNLKQGMEALEYVFRRLDKGEHHGKFWRTFYEPLNNAKDYELRMEDRIQGQLNAKISELGLDVKKMISEERTIASDVRTEGVKLTVDDMMAVYLHSKNMDNLRHILSPTGNRFTKQEVLNVIDALTPEEIQLADWMQATRQLDGILAAQVTWDTKMKNMLREQNYWMIERETRDVAVQNVDEELMEKIEAGKGLPPTQVEAGFTKERTHAAGNPIKLAALESFIAGESRVQHYIATMPVIDYLTRVVGNSEFAMSYIGKEGKSGWLMLHKWLQDVANPDLGTGARNQSERFMRWMRGNAASALLGFRVAQFFKAGLSWWVGAAEEGDLNAVRGLLSYIGNPDATKALIRTYAPQIYHRSMEREIAEAKIAQAIDARLAARKTLRETSMIFTVWGDQLSVMGLWKGKFDSYLRAHPDADPQVAADAASEVVRLTQAAWDVKDQPEIQRSGEAMKLLTMFTNEVTRHYSYLRDSMMQYHEKKLPFGQLLRRLIEVLLVQGLIMGSINRKAPPKDLGEATNDVVQQTLEVMLPVVGRYITNGMEGFVDSSPAGIKLLQELARGAANVTKIPDKGILPTVGSIATIMGYFYGLPVEGAKDVYKFLTPDQVKKAGAGTLPEGF